MTEFPPAPMQPEPWAPVPPVRSRRRLLIGILAALVAAAVIVVGIQLTLGVLNAHAAVRYTSAAEHYSVTAPGKPTIKKLKLNDFIPATATHWTDGDRYYAVVSGLGGPPSIQGIFLEGALETALKNAPGVTASSLTPSVFSDAFSGEPEQMKLSGEHALRTTATVKGAPAAFQIVFVGHGELLYMLVYSESADSRDTDFLASFKFVD